MGQLLDYGGYGRRERRERRKRGRRYWRMIGGWREAS